MSENSGSSAYDLPTTHRSTSTTTGVTINGKMIFKKFSSTVFYASHNGRVELSEGIIFGSDTSANNVLDDHGGGNSVSI